MSVQANSYPKQPAYWDVLIGVVRGDKTYHANVCSVQARTFAYLSLGLAQDEHIVSLQVGSLMLEETTLMADRDSLKGLKDRWINATGLFLLYFVCVPATPQVWLPAPISRTSCLRGITFICIGCRTSCPSWTSFLQTALMATLYLLPACA